MERRHTQEIKDNAFSRVLIADHIAVAMRTGAILERNCDVVGVCPGYQ